MESNQNTGPYESEAQAREAVSPIYEAAHDSPRRGVIAERNHKFLEDACRAAGAELGAYDHRILTWLAGWEPQICAVIAGLITRAATWPHGGHRAGQQPDPVTAADDRRVQWARELAGERHEPAEMSSQQMLQLLARYQDRLGMLLDVVQDVINCEIRNAEIEAAPADGAVKAALLAALPGEHTPADIATAEFLATYSWAADGGRVVVRWLRQVAGGSE